jgi:ribonuclease P protein component
LKRFSFPKKKRLVGNEQFKAVLARSLRVSNGLLTLYVAENDCGYPRLGVSVGKSCGGAIVRNRLKRLLREAFRQSQDRIPAGFDYLLMISPQGFRPTARRPADRGLLRKPAAKARTQPTFEQVKASFLTLATAAVGKIG